MGRRYDDFAARLNDSAQADKRRGAGCYCGDFAVRVNDFLTVGRSPIVGKCYSAEGLLTTTQVVGNKASVSV